jgi:antirestriction protein ArdC
MARSTARKGTKKSGNGTGNGRMTNAEINQMITDRMVAALEAGTVPWRKPWTTKGGGPPRSMASGKVYRGINIWTLALTAMDQGYNSQWWGTYRHIITMGGQVLRGEKSTKVVWWKRVIKPDPDNPEGEPVMFLIGSTDSVFNADQADWQEGSKFAPKPEDEPGELEEIPDAEEVSQRYLESVGPALRHLYQDRAYYQSGPRDTAKSFMRSEVG